jgi:hypothetical protein
MIRRVRPMGLTNLVKLSVDFLKEGDAVIAYCPSLDLSAHGSSLEEAKKAFAETFALFMDELKESGKLAQVLEECGWKRVSHGGGQHPRPRWTPPVHLGNLQEEFAIPV